MKISKFIFSIFILSLISSIVFTGCQQEEELDKSNRNEIYLSLPFNADFNKLTNEDREMALRILTNARENFSSMPDSEEKMTGMLETALIIQQLNMELNAP